MSAKEWVVENMFRPPIRVGCVYRENLLNATGIEQVGAWNTLAPS